MAAQALDPLAGLDLGSMGLGGLGPDQTGGPTGGQIGGQPGDSPGQGKPALGF